MSRLTRTELKNAIQRIQNELDNLVTIPYYDRSFFEGKFDSTKRKEFEKFQEHLPLLEKKFELETRLKRLQNEYHSRISEEKSSHKEIPTTGFKMWNSGKSKK